MPFDLRTPLDLFFNKKNWPTNWVLMTICFLIPIVGPIIMLGYMARCVAAWIRRESAADFDFNLFAPYLTQGLWPFLVTTVASMVLIPVFLIIPIGVGIILPVACKGGGEPAAIVVILIVAMVLVVTAVLTLLWTVVCVPMMLKSALEQNFAAGFSGVFIKDFIGRVGFFHILLVQFVLMLLMQVGMIAGMAALFFGTYFVMSMYVWVNWHVMYQLYVRYLDRGGTPINVHADLYMLPPTAATCPPPVPGAGGPPPVSGAGNIAQKT